MKHFSQQARRIIKEATNMSAAEQQLRNLLIAPTKEGQDKRNEFRQVSKEVMKEPDNSTESIKEITDKFPAIAAKMGGLTGEGWVTNGSEEIAFYTKLRSEGKSDEDIAKILVSQKAYTWSMSPNPAQKTSRNLYVIMTKLNLIPSQYLADNIGANFDSPADALKQLVGNYRKYIRPVSGTDEMPKDNEQSLSVLKQILTIIRSQGWKVNQAQEAMKTAGFDETEIQKVLDFAKNNKQTAGPTGAPASNQPQQTVNNQYQQNANVAAPASGQTDGN